MKHQISTIRPLKGLGLVVIAIICSCSCSIKSDKKYVIVDSFSQVVHETNDKEEAFEKADKMTLFGRVFPSKPQYFVLEVKN